ncbi:nitrate ABC transporter permease [Sphaerisporangium krabiense]|uniref:ABC-type nitrate/sulfonate/bicarbonate transport system permease component n=1 Tax=Sphaerisporangium krabiense TaxID=763782 RepID=A0A7W9DMT9_9ACTN|nr:ABC transporter permease [Sphaerisporangium krabiense]MBB5624309.1 ABC-type nitrate/sulfonate/bicarbonate transport system permease component [Sphaerisporangium krabiense]GII61741.1 nitrate ABC transporter permease [Sphaerisporangium krabiense]
MTAATTTISPGRGRLTEFLARVWLVPIALVAWEAGTRMAASDYFPPPSSILVRARELWFSGPATRLFLTDEALGDFLPSLGRMFGGWAAACVLGIGLGVAIGRSRILAGYVDPLVEFGRAIPPPALVPVFIVLFKLGAEMQVATIVYGVIWPVLVNAIDGARYVDRLHVETAHVFRLGRAQRLLRVLLPAAAPKIFAGLRLSVSLAVILMVLSELVGSTDGIGHQLLYTQQNFDLAGTWSVIVLLGVLGLALNGAFLAVERRVLSWHLRARQTT